MPPSKLMRAPATRSPPLVASVTRKLFIPTRGGCGSLTQVKAMSFELLEEFEQPLVCRPISDTSAIIASPKFRFRSIRVRHPASAAIHRVHTGQEPLGGAGFGALFPFIPFTAANRHAFLPVRWEHVVVHAQNHRNKDDGVIKEVKFNTRNK